MPSTSSLGVLRAQIERHVSSVDYPEEEQDVKEQASSITGRSNMYIMRSLEETHAMSEDVEFDTPQPQRVPPLGRNRGRSENSSGVWEDAIWKFHSNLERFKHHKLSRTI
ncbi:hypothetical protein DYB32_002677 [Aphanomyces invadans]|nr:hypothetical protein DYB32_002677 [Aphanomyces invadans]